MIRLVDPLKTSFLAVKKEETDLNGKKNAHLPKNIDCFPYDTKYDIHIELEGSIVLMSDDFF